jgi:hypothetical protein
MNHGLAQIFRACQPPRLANCCVVGRTIIIENQWMIRRDISYTLLKIAYRIAARGHHIAQQLVGVGDCASWAINKPRLHSPQDSTNRARSPGASGRMSRRSTRSARLSSNLLPVADSRLLSQRGYIQPL